MTCSQKTGHSKLEFSDIINNFENAIILVYDLIYK